MNAPVKHQTPWQAQPARFSTAEFLEMIEHDIFGDRKVELVDGEIIELPPPGILHGRLQVEVAAKLYAAVHDKFGLTVLGETGIRFFEGTLRGCDVAVVRQPPETGMLTPEMVVVAVEIAVSTLPRDLGEKASDYAEAGVAELWVVDPASSIVHVLRDPVDGDYSVKTVVRFGEPLIIPTSDLAITLD